MSEREGFYEKLWKDFVSLQRGDITQIIKRAEKVSKAIDLFMEIAPEVNERLKTYSAGSHFDSPSERVFCKFEKTYKQIKELIE